MAEYIPCYCSAYDFPHRPGGGKCKATGDTTCPNCGCVLADGQVTTALWAAETRFYPAEYVAVLLERCACCDAVGVVP
jgi:hypothetical protein